MEHAEFAGGEDRSILFARLGVGLLQGLALYLLYAALDSHAWPATDGFVFAPLLFLAVFPPLILLLGVGNLRVATLIVWTALVAVVAAALAWYGIWRAAPGSAPFGHWGDVPDLLPAFALWFFTAAGLFIAQALIAGGDHDRRFIAHYATHFDIAWKLALQLILAGIFAAVFWGVLLLGAGLFHLIGIDFFRTLIEHRWFAIPASTLAQAAALHLTDVRASLVRGARTLVLVLLSWLLPLMAAIAAGFLASLLSTGLAPLWKTRFAAGLLLGAAGFLVVLINAAYQDGEPERRPHAILRYAGSLACFVLVPIVAIAAYAIALRVEQYGWTTDRVGAAACAAVAAAYGLGYAAAAWPSGAWLARIPRWNFITSLLVLAVLAALFSPLADPMRIAVASQTARLEAGRIDAAKFDFEYLRWDGGRFGIAALKALARFSAARDAAQIHVKALAALQERTRYPGWNTPASVDVLANLDVYPGGRKLPGSFVGQKWSFGEDTVPCLVSASVRCDAYILDLAGDGQTEIALVGRASGGGAYFANALYARQSDGRWHKVGIPDPVWACSSTAAALRSGALSFLPAQPRWRDVMVNGRRLGIAPSYPANIACPP
jgi:hypothetical protein